jgi:fructosamine-3-kinase
MFEGEFESLLALEKTGCIRVPHPIKVLSQGNTNKDDGALLVMEYLNISSLGSKAEQLGTDLAM